jgi:hypothetical protein
MREISKSEVGKYFNMLLLNTNGTQPGRYIYTRV